jgi:hypothetical protein
VVRHTGRDRNRRGDGAGDATDRRDLLDVEALAQEDGAEAERLTVRGTP